MSSQAPLIIIVDDTPKNLQILGTVLRQEGYSVLAITDSRQAFSTIEKRQPDLILLDIMMPHLDGYAVCLLLKSNPATKNIPVIFLTAKTEKEDLIKGFNVGAVDYLTKPFNSDELLLRVRTQLQLQEAIKTATQANAVKSIFLANMSHDIRSPMNAIMGVLALMQNSDLTPQQKNYINIAKKAGTSLLCLVNDILDISKIEAGQLELNHVKFDLQEIIDDMVEIYSIDAYKKGLDFASIIDVEVLTQLIGDPERFKQIVINLLSNAIKFTLQGEVVIHVKKMEESRDKIQLCVSVRDSGKGISKDQISKLFKSYSQANATISREFGGTGLGLAISKQLIDMMDGTIHVQSEEKKGSIFSFTVWFEKQEDQQAFYPEYTEKIKQINILNIDRHIQARKSLSCQLKRLKCSFHEAFDAVSTLSKLKWMALEQKHFDAIFIDKETFDDTIKNMTHSMIADPSLKKTTFIVMQKLGKEDSHHALFQKCLHKPVRYDQLIECLKPLFLSDFEPIANAKNGIQTSSKHPVIDFQVNILLIDDSDINLSVSKALLQQLGYNADIALTSHEALQKLEHQSYDIIFTDIQMPVLNGIQLTEIIRNPESSVKNHHAYIVALTASSMKQDKEHCLKAGMNAYLTKPYTANQLKDLIENRDASFSAPPERSKNSVVLFDETLILERLHHKKQLILTLVDNYLDSHEALIEKLQLSIEKGVYEDVKFLAHRLKGEVSNLSSDELPRIYQEITQAAKDENDPLILNYYQQLKECNEQFREELTLFKQKLEAEI
ncbi:MAG: response regulator [Candidatus Magnetomorum sp.]|nr:response regulator [Candidatus Magnetomorum sp.]